MQLLKTSEKEALHEAGFTQVTIDDCNRLFSGFAPEAGAANFLAEFGEPVPEDFFKKQIEGSAELFRTRLTQLNAKTVLALAAAGRKQVVASGSPRDRVLVCLEVAGIDHLFAPEQVFTREDVPGRGKVRARLSTKNRGYGDAVDADRLSLSLSLTPCVVCPVPVLDTTSASICTLASA